MQVKPTKLNVHVNNDSWIDNLFDPSCGYIVIFKYGGLYIYVEFQF